MSSISNLHKESNNLYNIMDNSNSIWNKCIMTPWSIANTLHKIYNERIRYNENISKWEYYDDVIKEWMEDINKEKLKQLFMYDARLNIVNYIETLEDTIDINRLANISKYISTHFNLILKEAKEIFIHN